MSNMNDDLEYGIIYNDQKPQNKKKQSPKPQYQQGPESNRGLNKQQQLKFQASNYDLSASAHPFACVFTFAFKVAAVAIYFFAGIIFSSTIVFILVVIMSALDFWTVKNVTGRLLVGLKWQNQIDETGKQVWKFESHEGKYKNNGVDSAFFWTSQLIATVFWGAWLVIKILSLSVFWSVLVFINASLCFTNLYGYYKCRGQHNKKLQALSGKIKRQGFVHLANNLMK